MFHKDEGLINIPKAFGYILIQAPTKPLWALESLRMGYVFSIPIRSWPAACWKHRK